MPSKSRKMIFNKVCRKLIESIIITQCYSYITQCFKMSNVKRYKTFVWLANKTIMTACYNDNTVYITFKTNKIYKITVRTHA